MAPQLRIDGVTLRSPKKTANGRLRADGVFTRAGIFTYSNHDGSLRRELRPPSEVFAPASLASMEAMPVIDEHPTGGRADASHAQGWTLEGVRPDGDLVVGGILFTDADLVRTVESGKTALSVGYQIDYDPTPGVDPVYGRYDGVQRNIRGDHLAIVTAGRAGPEARLRMDAGLVEHEHQMRLDAQRELTPKNSSASGGNMTEAEIKQLQEALLAAKTRVDALEKTLVAEKARADAADGKAAALEVDMVKLQKERTDGDEVPKLQKQVQTLEADLATERGMRKDAEDPKARHQAAVFRAGLIRDAGVIMGDKFRIDHLVADRDIMFAVVEQLQGGLDKDCSSEYLRGRYDTAIKNWAAGERAERDVAARHQHKQETRDDAETAREKYIARQRSGKFNPNDKAQE